jgi:hypothetical protein
MPRWIFFWVGGSNWLHREYYYSKFDYNNLLATNFKCCMFKWLNLFSIFKFDQLLHFEQYNITITNGSTWEVLWVLNVKRNWFIFALSHNHAQQKAFKPLYKIYILGFCFLFKSIYAQLSFIKPIFYLWKAKRGLIKSCNIIHTSNQNNNKTLMNQ